MSKRLYAGLVSDVEHDAIELRARAVLVGDRSDWRLHPRASRRSIYVRPAYHPDTAPLPIGDELREQIASWLELRMPRWRRKARAFAHQYLRASRVATALSWIVIAVACGYLGAAIVRALVVAR